jgi:hypothetical protein
MDQDIRILVLHRGWVVVGHYSATADEVRLDKAAVVRRWGSQKGLGQIAAGGPTAETVLDACGVVRVHPLAVVLSIQCEADKWESQLK